MNDDWPGTRKYALTTAALMLLFVLALLALAWGREGRLPEPALWMLALVPPATVAVQFKAAYRLIAGCDEFVRALTAKRFLAAAGLSITVVTAWSVLEEFGFLPHAPAWLIYPLFWGAFGVVTPLIRSSNP